MGLPCSAGVSRVPAYFGFLSRLFPFHLRGCHSVPHAFPGIFSYLFLALYRGPNPGDITTSGLGSSAFARHYSQNRSFSFFSSRYLDVSVPRVPLITLFIHVMIIRHYPYCVSAFGHLRVEAHLQLSAAFRSLSRPSSAAVPRHPPFALCSLICLLSSVECKCGLFLFVKKENVLIFG